MKKSMVLRFIEKLIKLTLSNELRWRKIIDLDCVHYSCTFYKNYIVTLKHYDATDDGNDTDLIVYYAENEYETIYYDDCEFFTSVERLYNVVYNSLPNPSKAIDEFLNS